MTFVALISSHDNKTQEVSQLDRVPRQLSQEPQKAVPPSEEDDLVYLLHSHLKTSLKTSTFTTLTSTANHSRDTDQLGGAGPRTTLSTHDTSLSLAATRSRALHGRPYRKSASEEGKKSQRDIFKDEIT